MNTEAIVASSLLERQAGFAKAYGLTLDEYKRLVSNFSLEEITTYLELLKAKKHSSTFRKRSEEKLRAWLADPSPVRSAPFSPREYHWLKPQWPTKITLPR